MEITTKLINLLSEYIEEYKNLKEEYNKKRTNQTLYGELIQILNENNNEENKTNIIILLNTIYGDNIYVDELYRLSLQNNAAELKLFIENIIKDYNKLKFDNKNLKLRISRNYEMFLSAKRVRANLKYQTKISNSKNDIFNIKKIINYYETSGIISNKEELLLINEIELHNRNVGVKHSSNEEKDYTESLYNEIPNILNIGFQEHDVIEVSKDRKNTLDKFANEILNYINYVSIDEIEEILESYKKYNLDNNEYNYIVVKCLDEYLEELTTLYELLIDKEVYSKRGERIEVIKNYYISLEKYIAIRNYYNKLTEYTIDEPPLTEKNNEEPIVKFQEEKRLIYSRSDTNISKTKIISDMSDIPYEYYDTVYDLLSRFKK